MSNSSLPLAEVLGHEATDKRIDILRRIGEVGSISEAARGAGCLLYTSPSPRD